jgi:nitrite reductase/ring-hydroxylating ferredoxin subunit
LPEPTPGCRKVWDFLDADADATGAPAPRADGAAAAAERSARPIAADPAAEPPHWSPAPVDAAPPPGAVAVVEMEEGGLALAGARGRLFAFDAICGHHGKPMTGGQLSRFSFVCPHGPGCIYDIRDGARLGGGEPIACRPVRIDDRGRPLIGFGMPFTPDLPTF